MKKVLLLVQVQRKIRRYLSTLALVDCDIKPMTTCCQLVAARMCGIRTNQTRQGAHLRVMVDCVQLIKQLLLALPLSSLELATTIQAA